MYLELRGSLGYSHFEKIIKLVTRRDKEHVLNLSGVNFIDPYGLVGLITAARYCSDNGSSLKVYLPSMNIQTYLDTMGFFNQVKQFQNITRGFLSLLIFSRSDRPLLELTKLELSRGDFINIVNFSELLDRRMELMLDKDRIISKRLTTNLIEVCQNLEHSLDFGYVAAQKYNKPLHIKIGVMDLGIGITNALRDKYEKKHEKLTDRKAVEMALQPEVSSRDTGGGLGLYHLSQYIKEHAGSELIIRSGTVRCHLKHNGTRFFEDIPYFPGTQIGLTLRP